MCAIPKDLVIQNKNMIELAEFTNVCYIVARCCHYMVSFFHTMFTSRSQEDAAWRHRAWCCNRQILRRQSCFAALKILLMIVDSCWFMLCFQVWDRCATLFHLAAHSHATLATDALACNPKVEAGYGKHTGLQGDQQHLPSERWTKSEVAQCHALML